MTKEQKATYIAALINERAGYAQYGHTDKVAEVDAELERVGAKAKAPVHRATKLHKAHLEL